MSRIIPAIVTVIAVVVAITVWATTGDLLVPLALCAVAVAAWALAPGVLGRPERMRGLDVDPDQVKAYRSAHPGTTIGDAAVAVAEGRR